MADIKALKKIRDGNVARIIEALLLKGSLSRLEIAAECGIAPGTVTQLLGPLFDEGMVEEFKTGDSTGGRRPVYLRIRSEYGCIVTFEIRRDGLISRIHDLQGIMRAETRLASKMLHGNALFAAIADTVASVRRAPDCGGNIVCVGLLCQDDIQDSELGVLYSTDVSSDVIPFAMSLKAQLGVPVRKETIERFSLDYYIQKEAGGLHANYGYINIGDTVTASFTLDRKRVEIGGDATFDLTPFLSKDILLGNIASRGRRSGLPRSMVDIAAKASKKRNDAKITMPIIARIIQSACVFFPVDVVFLGGKAVGGDEAAREISSILDHKPEVRSWEVQDIDIADAFVKKLLERSAGALAKPF